MLLKIFVWLIRLSGLVALLLGLLVWTGNGKGLVMLHMATGLLLTLSLFAAGILIGFSKGGNIGLMLGAFGLGALIVFLGVTQATLLIGPWHWIIQVIHLLLGVSAVIYAQIILKRHATQRRIALA